MPDWGSSMQQTYEYYVVDPATWKDVSLIDTVKGCSINRDSEVDTLGSATFDLTGSIGECYIRVYLITLQNGVKEKFPLGTFLLQTPSTTFNGKVRNISVDAYTPLIELKENQPQLGYTAPKFSNPIQWAYHICNSNTRAPVVMTTCREQLQSHFAANIDDTWFSYVKDLIATIRYSFDLDELGRIMFAPWQDIASMQPVWTYTDDNSSILYPDLTMDHDLFGVPNEILLIFTTGFYDDEFGGMKYSYTVTNNDSNSPTSVASRGRKIVHREVDPNIAGEGTVLTKNVVDNYAKSLLRSMSSLEYRVTYTHGYCPVRVGDCVRLNYQRAGLVDIKAKVISQTIKCEPGCPVTETAVFTTKLWGG